MLLDKRCTSTLFHRYYSLEIEDRQKSGVSQSINPNTVQLSRMEGPNGSIPSSERVVQDYHHCKSGTHFSDREIQVPQPHGWGPRIHMHVHLPRVAIELICGPKLTQLFLINPGCLCFEASSLYVKIRYNQTLKDKLFKS